MGLGVLVLMKMLMFVVVFSVFGDFILWLIVLVFFFVKGFIKMGLGNWVVY